MAETAIEIASLEVVYVSEGGPFQALAPTSLTIRKGEFVSLLGPSGCGKTTLLRAISGLSAPTSGVAKVAGTPVTGPRTEMGIVFQAPILLEWLTVLENILLQVEARPIDRRKATGRALELLDQVGLKGWGGRYPSQLSGGMKQRVALCRALVHGPDILVMDEPFGALDSITRDQMGLDLQKMWAGGDKTVVFVTHDIAEAVFLSDRVVVMAPSPGRVEMELTIDLPRPRRIATRDSDAFFAYCRQIRTAFERNGILREHD